MQRIIPAKADIAGKIAVIALALVVVILRAPSQAITILEGPWRFHAGDDLHWAAEDFRAA